MTEIPRCPRYDHHAKSISGVAKRVLLVCASRLSLRPGHPPFEIYARRVVSPPPSACNLRLGNVQAEAPRRTPCQLQTRITTETLEAFNISTDQLSFALQTGRIVGFLRLRIVKVNDKTTDEINCSCSVGRNSARTMLRCPKVTSNR